MRKLLAVGFWLGTALLLGIIAYGISTSGLKAELTSKTYPADRLLDTRPARGVQAEVRVRDLENRPVLVVRGRGLDADAPLRLWLGDPTRGKPAPLRREIDVDRKGRVRTEIPLPERALFNYRSVIGIQRGRVVFRASLS